MYGDCDLFQGISCWPCYLCEKVIPLLVDAGFGDEAACDFGCAGIADLAGVVQKIPLHMLLPLCVFPLFSCHY
jgi:hypothetical protein